jgi:virulence factor
VWRVTILRTALVGLGDIAQKAYLPVLAARADITPVLVTRNAETLRRVGSQYRLPEQYTDLDAAFVHVATEAHVAVVTQLLAAGVPVFVDKPLADTYADAAAIADAAVAAGVPLMVGFNRRYAPAYAEIAQWPQRDIVVMQKNRTGPQDDVRRSVFDDFIHVVDTVRFLGPPVATAAVSGAVVDGRLQHVVITLTDGVRSATGVMNRTAGLSEESLEVFAPGRKRRVINVSEVVDLAGGEQLTRRDEWRSVGVQRGFAPMCQTFLDGVRGGPMPDLDDAVRTHLMCEQIIAALTG